LAPEFGPCVLLPPSPAVRIIGVMAIEYTTSGRDLHVWTYSGTSSDVEYDEALAGMKRALDEARREQRKVAFITVGKNDSMMSSKQRGRTVSWIEEHGDALRESCVCTGVVVPGALQRGVLTAILWMITYPVPIRAIPSIDEAHQWARSMLDDARVARRAS
jgi:hypothetical protein